ncbi:MAG: hypothetical protein ACOY30_12685 [Bacillota bacterium]
MAKNAKSPRKKEMLIEKTLSRRNQIDQDFAVGDSFVEEPTGSATMVNLDGRWDFDRRVNEYPPDDARE